jgi:8-oxo-dGTP diphosphatase
MSSSIAPGEVPRFTIRVYGLVVHDGMVLVADEMIRGQAVTKFPGGGLEYGEGTRECLARELREELAVEAEVLDHFYTTDFFQQSVFHKTPMQVVSIYYKAHIPFPEELVVTATPFAAGPGQLVETFRWLPLATARPEDVSLPIDRLVLELLLKVGS